MSLGLCITPDFYPTTEQQEDLNPAFYRSILYHLSDLNTLYERNKPLIISLNNQCAEVRGDWSGWDSAVYQICLYFSARDSDRLLVLGAGNELDLYWANGDNSVGPEFAADLAIRTKRIAENFGIKVATTSLAGPRWPEYLQLMHNLCGPIVDYFDMHPYGQRPEGWRPKGWADNRQWMHGELENVITYAQNVTGKPIICSEYGVKIDDAGNAAEVSDFMLAADKHLHQLGVPYTSWFCYDDRVGSPGEVDGQAFGLLDLHNLVRPAYFSFMEANITVPNVPPVSDDEYEKWASLVGAGLLDMMKADNTYPTMASEWRPFDRPPGTPATIEQCIGLNNVTYCWNLNTGSGWRIRPS